MTSVVVCGIAGQLPLAGVALHYLQYCLGFRSIGVDAFYLEDNWTWPYSPVDNEPDEDAGYTVPWLTEMFDAFDQPWAYRDPKRRWWGTDEADVAERCANADLLLNVSGGTKLYEFHRLAKRLAFVDTDPTFVQIGALRDEPWRLQWLAEHDVLFTFAEAMNEPWCRVPRLDKDWITTRQPVHLPFWNEVTAAPGDTYSTVMNWTSYGSTRWEGEDWGQKDAEFPLILEVPATTGIKAELSLGGSDAPQSLLQEAGWAIADAWLNTQTIWKFRDYIARSRAELTVAKQAYVRSRSGWFSERSANYLAAGRPVVTQDTGWSSFLPSGGGLHAFSTNDGARAAIRRVERDVVAEGLAARAVAAEYFDARKVLPRMLDRAGVT